MKVSIILLSCLLAITSACPPRKPPRSLPVKDVPQFVLLSFDDAINAVNYERTYKKLFDIVNKANKCPIHATFFVSHDNTNYQMVNEMWARGHEIASHSITHKSDQPYWKNESKKHWIDEAFGQRTILANLSDIPISEIVGYRSPFLQTAGDATFEVLQENGFKYDCSMPTRGCSKPHPSYPYNLERGFQQDCEIEPCPKKKYSDFWLFPMNDWWRTREIEGKNVSTPCSMIDMCLPQPETRKETFDYMLDNFNRYDNRAPFPIFMHESYIVDQNRNDGLFDFIKHLVTKDEVFFVTFQEVLEWMKNPVTIDKFKQTKCPDQSKLVLKCDPPSTKCQYKKVEQFWNNTKEFFICSDDSERCPTKFPWVDNWSTVLR